DPLEAFGFAPPIKEDFRYRSRRGSREQDAENHRDRHATPYGEEDSEAIGRGARYGTWDPKARDDRDQIEPENREEREYRWGAARGTRRGKRSNRPVRGPEASGR